MLYYMIVKDKIIMILIIISHFGMFLDFNIWSSTQGHLRTNFGDLKEINSTDQ